MHPFGLHKLQKGVVLQDPPRKPGIAVLRHCNSMTQQAHEDGCIALQGFSSKAVRKIVLHVGDQPSEADPLKTLGAMQHL